MTARIFAVTYGNLKGEKSFIKVGDQFYSGVTEDWVFPDDRDIHSVDYELVTFRVDSFSVKDFEIIVQLSVINVAQTVDRFPANFDVTTEMFKNMCSLTDHFEGVASGIDNNPRDDLCVICQEHITNNSEMMLFSCMWTFCMQQCRT